MLKGKDFMAALRERVKSNADNPGMAKATKVVYDELAELINKQLRIEGEVNLPNIGKFSVVDREATTRTNPDTGETVEVPARKVVKFGMAKQIKETLNPQY